MILFEDVEYHVRKSPLKLMTLGSLNYVLKATYEEILDAIHDPASGLFTYCFNGHLHVMLRPGCV